jgi:hypothetical protein
MTQKPNPKFQLPNTCLREAASAKAGAWYLVIS